MEANPDGHGYGAMNLYQTTFNKSGKFNLETQLDNKVCECCPTSAIKTENALILAYRDRSDKEIRNINIIRFANGQWSNPYPVNDDKWKITGMIISLQIIVLIDTVATITIPVAADPTVNVSFSEDEGNSFEKPIRVDLSKPIGRVDLVWLNKEEVIVSWVEISDKSTNILSRIVSKNGDMYKAKIISEIEPGRVAGLSSNGKS